MEQINTIQLTDENVYPDTETLKAVLGRSYGAYCGLLKLFDENGLLYEWRYYKDGKAWLCKAYNKKKTVVWMSAWKGYVKATVYFPEKYLELLNGLNISDETKKTISDTKNVGRSKPCTFELRNNSALKDLSTLMKLKIELK